MTVTSGLKCCELLKSCSPVGYLAKMLLGSSSWASTVRYLTWKPRATKQGRLYFLLAPSVLRMSESACSYWPTPDTNNHRDGTKMRKEAKGRHAVSLHHAVALLPTPTAGDAEGSSGGNQRCSLRTTAGGQLNPTWVELLMGFPPGWTDLNA